MEEDGSRKKEGAHLEYTASMGSLWRGQSKGERWWTDCEGGGDGYEEEKERRELGIERGLKKERERREEEKELDKRREEKKNKFCTKKWRPTIILLPPTNSSKPKCRISTMILSFYCDP